MECASLVGMFRRFIWSMRQVRHTDVGEYQSFFYKHETRNEITINNIA